MSTVVVVQGDGLVAETASSLQRKLSNKEDSAHHGVRSSRKSRSSRKRNNDRVKAVRTLCTSDQKVFGLALTQLLQYNHSGRGVSVVAKTHFSVLQGTLRVTDCDCFTLVTMRFISRGNPAASVLAPHVL